MFIYYVIYLFIFMVIYYVIYLFMKILKQKGPKKPQFICSSLFSLYNFSIFK